VAAERTLTVSDILDLVWRRRQLILLVTAVATGLAAVGISQLKDVFLARSVVYIESGRMPASYERAGGVVPKLNQLIGPLRQEVLSRDILRDLVNDLDLYQQRVPVPAEAVAAGLATTLTADPPPGLIGRLFYKDPIERARADIKIDVTKRYGEDFVEISVRARAPELAARAVNRIADILAAKNRDLRIKRTEEVQVFLDNELAKVTQQLQEQEAALSRFREDHWESLPENEGHLVERLYALRTATQDRRRRIEDANARRAEIEHRLGILTQSSSPGGGPDPRAGLELELRRLEQLEQQLAAKRKPRHPDLVRTRAEIESMRQRIAALGGPLPAGAIARALPPAPAPSVELLASAGRTTAGGTGARPSGGAAAPVAAASPSDPLAAPAPDVDSVDRLMSELATLSRQVETLTRDEEQDVREIERLESQKNALGTTRIRLEKLHADFEETSKTHRELQNDRRDVEKFLVAAGALKGDQLRTIEAAEAPLLPSEPNRPFLLGVSFLGALGLGLALAYLLELRKEMYRTSLDLERDLGFMVLAVLPDVSRWSWKGEVESEAAWPDEEPEDGELAKEGAAPPEAGETHDA
jgi:uncharacterized protein involved in exopolysaccharide biosynthesis